MYKVKTLYIECNMGAAGDMLMGALLELTDRPEDMLREINKTINDGLKSMGKENTVEIFSEKSAKCGIVGTHMVVKVDGREENCDAGHYHSEHSNDEGHVYSDHICNEEHLHNEHIHNEEYSHSGHSHSEGHVHSDHSHNNTHHHAGMSDISSIINSMKISDKVKADAISVYNLIAEAESHAHGKSVDEIHFHEVGTLDAVADVVGVCMLMNTIAPDRVTVSPVHVGSGHVHCAHGILPVPAPATADILKGVPIYGGSIKGELCTPTGAALLRYFADEFGDMPVMRTERIGYGMGKKDFSMANCVRIMIGENQDKINNISELCCNLDDMTPEQIGYATELLMREGALDVYITDIHMKKNRPAHMLTCMCKTKDREKFLGLIFKHTTTLGIREYECNRYCLNYEISQVETNYGTVHIKRASGYGTVREKYEYEDLARIAGEQDMAVREVERKIKPL